MLHKALTRVHFTFGFRVRPNKKPQIPFNNWKIVKGDTIQVRTGSDKGIVGKVEKVYRKSNSVVVEGVNLIKKSFRDEQEKSVTKDVPQRIHISNIGLYDSVAKRAVRVKFGYHPETYEKLRISRKTGIIIEKPKLEHTREARGKNRQKGEKDTSTDLAHKITYTGEDFEQIKKEFEAFISEKERKEKNLVFAF